MSCTILKINEDIVNDNLPRLGELSINFAKIENPSSDSQKIVVSFTESVEVYVKNGNFTDSTLSTNEGTKKTITSETILYVTNGSTFVISNKYALKKLDLTDLSKSKNKYLKLEDLEYCSNINSLNLNGTNSVGNLEFLSNMKKLRVLNISNTFIYGNIDAITNSYKLEYFIFYYCNIYGSIESYTNKMYNSCGKVASSDRGTTKPIYFEGYSSLIPDITWQGIRIKANSSTLTWDINGTPTFNKS